MSGSRASLFLVLAAIAATLLVGCGSSQAPVSTSSAGPPMQGLLDSQAPQQMPQQAAGQAGQQSAAPGQQAASAQRSNGPAPGSALRFEDTSSGLQFSDLIVGTGPSATAGQTVFVDYTGWLESNGQKFDSSYDHAQGGQHQPFKFALGNGEVIKGWDEGVAAMRVGGKRRLIIPANLAYGAAGSPPQIPPDSALVFDVELRGIQQSPYRTE